MRIFLPICILYSNYCLAIDQLNVRAGSSLSSGVKTEYSTLSQTSSYQIFADVAHSFANTNRKLNIGIGYQHSKYLRNTQNIDLGSSYMSNYVFAKVGIGFHREMTSNTEIYFSPSAGIGRFVFENTATSSKHTSYPAIACGEIGARYFFTDTSKGGYILYSLEYQKVFVDTFSYQGEVFKNSEFDEDIKIVLGLGKRF